MAGKGKKRPVDGTTTPVEPRLFLIRLEGDGKRPSYVMCERTAVIEQPANEADEFAGTMYRKVEELFAERAKIAPPLPAIGIPAEVDPRGGGYMIMGSSMGNGQSD